MLTYETFAMPQEEEMNTKDKSLRPLLYDHNPVANLRLSMAYDRGVRAATRFFVCALLWIIALVALLIVGTRGGHAQNQVPPFNTPGMNGVLNTDLYQGAEWGAKILAASAKAPTGINTELQINTPGAIISSALTMPANRFLHLRQNVILSTAITFSSSDYVACDPGVSITVTNSLAYAFATSSASNSILGCIIHGPTGFAGGYVLHATGSPSSLTMRANVIDGMGAFESINASGTTGPRDVVLDGNTITYPTSTAANAAGGMLFFVVGARVTNNRCINTLHCFQWWGGDAGGFTLSTGAAAKMTFIGNHCKGMYQACIWGSMGTDIDVTSNESDTNGDVAFDTEGGVRTHFADNAASNCGNGCNAWFYSDQDISFAGEVSQADGSSAFLGKNSSVIPSRQVGISITGSTITCTALCNAAVFDALTSLHFNDNLGITNARILPTSYCAVECSFSRNIFNLTAALAAHTVLSVPSMVGGGTTLVEGNHIRSAVTQTNTVAGIAGISQDFNYANYTIFRANEIWGLSSGITTASNGGNAGVPTYWTLEQNKISATTPIVHTAANTNEIYRVLPSNTDFTGASLGTYVNVDQIAVGNSCSTSATTGAQCTTNLAFTNASPVPFFINCSIYATSGVPGVLNYSNVTNAKSFAVTIQATTAAAASGTLVCKQQSQG